MLLLLPVSSIERKPLSSLFEGCVGFYIFFFWSCWTSVKGRPRVCGLLVHLARNRRVRAYESESIFGRMPASFGVSSVMLLETTLTIDVCDV